MRSRDQHADDVALKPQKRKSSSKKRSNHALAQSRWPKVAISRSANPHEEPDNAKRKLSRFGGCSTVIDTNHASDVIAYRDIVDLFCESSDASNEGRTTCPQISSSTELDEDSVDVCSTCKDCAECQLQQQQQQNIAKTEESLTNDRDEELAEHLDYYEGDISDEAASTPSTDASIEHEEMPILVDLTSEESKQTTWKQRILKRFDDAEESSEMSEPRIMIADSSSRLQRTGTGGTLATALRDRGPCVIPVQPNRSLPIRPAPPIPTRSAASVVTSRKAHSVLKLSKSMGPDVVEIQSDISPRGSLTNELNEFLFGQQDGKDDEMMLSRELIDHSDYVLPDMTNVMQIAKEVNSVKRKNDEIHVKEYEKETIKDMKKQKKSHETNASHIHDERIKNILKQYSKTCTGTLVDKKGKKSQQHLVVRLWDEKRCSSSIVVSTTHPETEKSKEICNKVVPPLRLKKIVREASISDEYRKIEVNADSGSESNYRIVTGATPRPELSGYSSTSFWSSIMSEQELESPTNNAHDKSRRSSPKSDGYKIKYRRNRLRQKLRELRGKALELSREMTACNSTDTSPQRSTRLRQMMNCYEKQIENVSKLLCKLSASIPPTTDNAVVDLDYETELDERTSAEKTPESDNAQVNGISRSSISPSPSPGPPKLSPRSPIDYEKDKSPDAMRNSPPVLPRVYIAIQPTPLECLQQNLSASKSWHANNSSSGTPIEKEVKVNNADRELIRGDVIAAPILSPISSPDFDGPSDSATKWDDEQESPSSKLKNLEIAQIAEDANAFDDAQKHRVTPPISSNSFLKSMNIDLDESDVRDTKERSVVQGCLDDVAQTSEVAASKKIACKKQELEQESNEALPSGSLIVERPRKRTEYENYNSTEEKLSGEGRVAGDSVATAQEASTTVGRSQIPVANMTNILQLQSNYYGSSVARDNVVFTSVIQNSRDAQKVTSSMSQSVALDPTMPLAFTQSTSTVSSSNQQCVIMPNSSKVIQENTNQRADGNRIMTEQFPTLGNWVAECRMAANGVSKKQSSKSKSKLQSNVTLPTASTAEVARIPGLEAQKARTSTSNNGSRNNIVNVTPQWNTERWQRQQRQQQLYAASASSAAPPVRPGLCPPISVTQFYPPNYAIDPYGSAFGYHSTICPYGNYPYHSRLHATAPPISGYQMGPLQNTHASPLRQMQHLDKRFPAHLQNAATRHFTTDLLKYPGALSAGSYQHTAAGLEYDRLRTATSTTQNGTAGACLPSLLLPPHPALAASAQQTLARTSLARYPASNGQCGRNGMMPDVVAAAAAAAVLAAASLGRQRDTLPTYRRADTEIVPRGIGSVMDNESTQLIAPNRATNCERLPQEQVQSIDAVGGINVDSRLNNGNYRQLQNLILDRLPYVKTDDAYPQPSAIYDGTQESAVASSMSTSTYKPTPIRPPGVALATKEGPVRKESRNCETPHLGKVNRTLETTNNLECSNCGLIGSMFKCLGCEAAFYCDEMCQTRHWTIHVEKCPKRMPKLKKLL